MLQPANAEIDVIEELRIRRWARENYLPLAARDPRLHPLVLDEMGRKDRELAESLGRTGRAFAYVPLAPDEHLRHDPQHLVPAAPNLLLTVAEISVKKR